MRFEKIKRPVDGDRRWPGTVIRHSLNDVISSHRGVTLRNAAQHLPTLFRQPGTTAGACLLSARQDIRRALGVVVVVQRQRHLVIILHSSPVFQNQSGSVASSTEL